MKKGNTTLVASFFTILVLGFIISVYINKFLISFFTVILTGFMIGKFVLERERRLMFPISLVTSGFIIGFLLGNKMDHSMLLLMSFFISMFAGIIAKKLLKDKF